jgi:hypothetical protein
VHTYYFSTGIKEYPTEVQVLVQSLEGSYSYTETKFGVISAGPILKYALTESVRLLVFNLSLHAAHLYVYDFNFFCDLSKVKSYLFILFLFRGMFCGLMDTS